VTNEEKRENVWNSFGMCLVMMYTLGSKGMTKTKHYG